MNVLYFAFLVFSVIAGVLDAASSQNFIYYNGDEGGVTSDKYGYHSNLKELYMWGPVYAIGFIVPFLPFFTPDASSFGIGAFLYGAIGGYRLNELFRNHKKMREGRKKQQAIVKNIMAAIAAGDDQGVQSIFDSLLTITKGGQTRYGQFGWLYSTNPEINAAVLECRAKVVDWIKSGAVYPK